jgi:hypothetical protein
MNIGVNSPIIFRKNIPCIADYILKENSTSRLVVEIITNMNLVDYTGDITVDLRDYIDGTVLSSHTINNIGNNANIYSRNNSINKNYAINNNYTIDIGGLNEYTDDISNRINSDGENLTIKYFTHNSFTAIFENLELSPYQKIYVTCSLTYLGNTITCLPFIDKDNRMKKTRMIQKGNPLTVIGSAGYINNIKSKFFLSPYESLDFFSSRNYFDYTYSYASATSYLSTTVTPSVSNKVYISNWGMWSDNMVGVKLYLTNINNALIHVCDLTWETSVYDNTVVVPSVFTKPKDTFLIRRNCDINGVNYRNNILPDQDYFLNYPYYPNGYPDPSIPNIDSNNPDTDFTRKRNYTYKYESTITDFNPEYLVGNANQLGEYNQFYNYLYDGFVPYSDYEKYGGYQQGIFGDLWVASYFLNYNTPNVYVNGKLKETHNELGITIGATTEVDGVTVAYTYYNTALLNNFEYKTLCKHNIYYDDNTSNGVLDTFRNLVRVNEYPYSYYSGYTSITQTHAMNYLNDVLNNSLHDYPVLPTIENSTVFDTYTNTSVFENQSSLTKYLFEFESSTKFIVKSGSEILGVIHTSAEALTDMNTTVVYSTFNNKYSDYYTMYVTGVDEYPGVNAYRCYGSYRMTSGVESLGFCYAKDDNNIIYSYDDIKQHIYIPYLTPTDFPAVFVKNLFKDDTGWYFEQVYKNVIQIPCFAKNNGTILKAIKITINDDLKNQGFSVSVPVFISSTKDNNNFIYEYVMRLDMPASAVSHNPGEIEGTYINRNDVYIPATYVLVFIDNDGNEFKMKAIDIVV